VGALVDAGQPRSAASHRCPRCPGCGGSKGSSSRRIGFLPVAATRSVASNASSSEIRKGSPPP
jgi:hypothetical protein